MSAHDEIAAQLAVLDLDTCSAQDRHGQSAVTHFPGEFAALVDEDIRGLAITTEGSSRLLIGRMPRRGRAAGSGAYLDADTNTLYAAALNGSRTDGFLSVGQKS